MLRAGSGQGESRQAEKPDAQGCRVCAAVEDHDDWNAGARGETPLQRADRAYGEILQELRVAQTGVQILFAFLLTLAFQARFGSITSFQRHVYVVTLMLCAGAAALLIAPAAFHRVVYRMRLKQHLVRAASRLALCGMVMLLLSLVSAVLLVMDVVLGLVPAIALAAVVLVWFAIWWFVLPLISRARHQAADGRARDVRRQAGEVRRQAGEVRQSHPDRLGPGWPARRAVELRFPVHNIMAASLVSRSREGPPLSIIPM
jgi:Family of unknown function (DUF6328)